MKAQSITLTPEELLAISPDVRAKYRELVTPKRSPQSGSADTNALLAEFGDLEISESLATPISDSAAVYTQSPTDSTIVAKDSYALRSVSAVVGGREVVECILDPGCQVISMSEPICHALGLTYDPTIKIPIQSANKQVNNTLGLVRNVSIEVGDITVYVQAHVVRDAAYDILLGRPFDVLTRSVVTNFDNAEQTITIECPNSGRVSTIPTYPRGNAKYQREIVKSLRESQDPNFR